MRKILFAMLGLVAIGLWALPAMALPGSGGAAVVDGPKVRSEVVPLENRGLLDRIFKTHDYEAAVMALAKDRKSTRLNSSH